MKKIPENSYRKLRFQTKGQILKALEVFDMYGLGTEIPNAAETCMIAAELFCENVRGDEKPITVEKIRQRRIRKK